MWKIISLFICILFGGKNLIFYSMKLKKKKESVRSFNPKSDYLESEDFLPTASFNRHNSSSTFMNLIVDLSVQF